MWSHRKNPSKPASSAATASSTSSAGSSAKQGAASPRRSCGAISCPARAAGLVEAAVVVVDPRGRARPRARRTAASAPARGRAAGWRRARRRPPSASRAGSPMLCRTSRSVTATRSPRTRSASPSAGAVSRSTCRSRSHCSTGRPTPLPTTREGISARTEAHRVSPSASTGSSASAAGSSVAHHHAAVANRGAGRAALAAAADHDRVARGQPGQHLGGEARDHPAELAALAEHDAAARRRRPRRAR